MKATESTTTLLETADVATLRAIAAASTHPTQLAILGELHQSGGELISPKQIANRLGGSLGSIAYHVRALERKRLIELVDTAARRGATEHFYRLVSFDGQAGGQG